MQKWKRLVSCALVMALLQGGAAMGETRYFAQDMETVEKMEDDSWYLSALDASVLSLGNNQRLKNVIARAQSGEQITIAAIGGSITEGAGASVYQECYACRFYQGFAERYGTESKNVHFVNAGVGGTPSTFGLMRYDRDVAQRTNDADGLPDLVIVEYAVNDYNEPTKGRCYESLVKTILTQENDPAVILLFSVSRGDFTLEKFLGQVGSTYDLTMVSVKAVLDAQAEKAWTKEAFFFDEYHPTSLGHAVMADCLLRAVDRAANEDPSPADIDLTVNPVYGTDFMGLRTIYGEGDYPGVRIERGGFASDDTNSYRNQPVGRVCGKNFHHAATDSSEPLRLTFTFRKLLIAWRACADSAYGEAEIVVDGKVKRTLKGGEGKWGQSEVILLWDAKEAAEHTLEIRMAEGSEHKRFTITAIGYTDE